MSELILIFLFFIAGIWTGIFIQCLRHPKTAGRLIFTKIEGQDIVLAEFNKDPNNYKEQRKVIMYISHE